MNRWEKTLISGAVGTSFMTAASVLMSLVPAQAFREPDQLAILVGRLLPFLSKRAQLVADSGADLFSSSA